jgi:alkylation response protein AidB-like acyl-CoA dehydrogenase
MTITTETTLGTGAEMRAKVAAALPLIAQNASKAETGRKVPTENIEALRDAGFFKALQPAKYGGTQMGAEEYTPAVVAIAGACASTAWASGLLAQHSHMLALMSPELQDEVWGDDPDAIASSSVAAINTCEEASGGVRLSGSWGWSSGCDHASWAILGFRRAIPELGGMLIPHFGVVPMKDLTIIDDWNVSALCGTGSKTLRLDNVFVPEHRIESIIALSSGGTRGFGSNPGIFHAPFSPWFSLGFSAVSLGISLRFMELYKDKVKTRVRAYTGAAEVNSVPALLRIAESHHQLTATQATLEKDWTSMTEHAVSGRLPDENVAVHWRANQSYATKNAIGALDRLWAASGGTAFFNDQEMQRLWRDSKMTGSHAYSDYDIARQRHGRQLLGLDPDMSIF